MREIKFRQRNKNNGQWHYWGWVDGKWVMPKVSDNYEPPEKSDQIEVIGNVYENPNLLGENTDGTNS